MARTEPVSDWTSDFDVLDEAYVRDPFPRWDELRQTCPIARTDRRGRAWLPTTYADVTALAKDVEHFSSANTSVIDSREEEEKPDPHLRPAADHLRPPAAHVDPSAAAPRGSPTPGWRPTSR